MSSIDNPFDIKTSLPGRDASSPILGPLGNELRRTIKKRYGSVRSAARSNESEDTNQLLTDEEKETISAYENRERFFDDANASYKKLTIETYLGEAQREGARLFITAQKQAGLSSQPFIEALEETHRSAPTRMTLCALDTAYVAAERYEEAYNLSQELGQPNDHQQFLTLAELFDALTKASSHLPPYASNDIVNLISAFSGVTRKQITDKDVSVVEKFVDTTRRLGEPAPLQALERLFDRLSQTSIAIRNTDPYTEQTETTIANLFALLLRAGKIDQAAIQLLHLTKENKRALVHLALAQHPSTSPEERMMYLAEAESIIALPDCPLERYPELIAMSPEEKIPSLLKKMKEKAERKKRTEYRVRAFYEVLKVAALHHDEQMIRECFGEIENQYVSGRTSNSNGMPSSIIETVNTYIRARHLMNYDTTHAIKTLMEALSTPGSQLADIYKPLHHSYLFEIADVFEEVGKDTSLLLSHIATVLESTKMYSSSEKDDAYLKLLKRQTRLAIQRCTEAKRKRDLLFAKEV